jgi:hypothetical protein
MVEYSVRWEIVNEMRAARRRGHGRVKQALEFRGVARSSAYRWEADVRWLLDEGAAELRRLRAQLDRLSAQLAEQGPAPPAVRALSGKEERAFMLAAMAETEEGKGLAGALGGFGRQPAYAHLGVFDEKLGGLRLEQLGPAREAKLARVVAETLAWRRRDKTPVEWLARAATGSLADKVELAVLRAVDAAIRSSSAVECVNSRVRPVQVARKRLSKDFIYLLAVYHNMRPFGRGSLREDHSPAELAGIKLPTRDWIELLDLVAADLDRAAREASLN